MFISCVSLTPLIRLKKGADALIGPPNGVCSMPFIVVTICFSLVYPKLALLSSIDVPSLEFFHGCNLSLLLCGLIWHKGRRLLGGLANLRNLTSKDASFSDGRNTPSASTIACVWSIPLHIRLSLYRQSSPFLFYRRSSHWFNSGLLSIPYQRGPCHHLENHALES